MSKTKYPNMPEPDTEIVFDGETYNAWYVEHAGERVKVSETALQTRLFAGGSADGDYVSDEARRIDESIAFYIWPDESVADVISAIWE